MSRRLQEVPIMPQYFGIEWNRKEIYEPPLVYLNNDIVTSLAILQHFRPIEGLFRGSMSCMRHRLTPSLKPQGCRYVNRAMLARTLRGLRLSSIFNPHNRNFNQSAPMATSNHISKVAIVGVRDMMLCPASPANHRLTSVQRRAATQAAS